MNPKDPAFPSSDVQENTLHYPGVSKLELFSVVALHGLCSDKTNTCGPEEIAKFAFKAASALCDLIESIPKTDA
jgi:hypothetical protein